MTPRPLKIFMFFSSSFVKNSLTITRSIPIPNITTTRSTLVTTVTTTKPLSLSFFRLGWSVLHPTYFCQVLYYLWFTIALVYFSLALNSHVLFPSTLHLNTAAAGALELPAYTITLVALLYAGKNSSSWTLPLSDPEHSPENPKQIISHFVNP